MSGFYNICFNYPETMQQAKRIEQIAGRCGSLNTRVKNEVDHVNHCWKGKSSDALVGKLEALITYHKSLESILYGVAQDMKTVVNQMKEADEASIVRQIKL